jgi:hypothetical protein
MFESFEDILNQHIFVPFNFSGIAICDIDYLITNVSKEVNRVDDNYGRYIMSRHQYSVDFEIIHTNVKLSNKNYG